MEAATQRQFPTGSSLSLFAVVQLLIWVTVKESNDLLF